MATARDAPMANRCFIVEPTSYVKKTDLGSLVNFLGGCCKKKGQSPSNCAGIDFCGFEGDSPFLQQPLLELDASNQNQIQFQAVNSGPAVLFRYAVLLGGLLCSSHLNIFLYVRREESVRGFRNPCSF
jgi:hypothetical protein